jgi:hypothetical protein
MYLYSSASLLCATTEECKTRAPVYWVSEFFFLDIGGFPWISPLQVPYLDRSAQILKDRINTFMAQIGFKS